jgi:hypothetical protein
MQPGPISTIPPPAAAPAVAGGSELYRIGTDGYPQRVWTHPQDIVYSIAFDASGRPVLGTGNKGNIYRVDSEQVSTLLVNASPTQVTAFATGPKGRLFAATGNVGKVYQVGPEIEKQGSYESEALDGQFFSYWGRVRHKGELNGGGVRIETRSGNLDRPQKNWSAWAPLDTSSRITSPSARFLQYRVTLTSAASGSPEVREIEIAHMPKNVPPAIEEIDITPANHRFPPVTTLSSTAPATISLPPIGQQRRPASLPLTTTSSTSQSVQYAKGWIGARWAASDPNGDELLYRIEMRGVQEQEWKLLRDEVKERYLSWESTAFPDGEYLLRVTATDAPANPADQALTTKLESDRFLIDNTAPQIAGLTGARTGKSLSIRWRARDATSTIQKSEYSVNGAEWVLVQPTTRLSDAPEHEYTLSLDAAEGEQTIAVRVTDEYDNQTVDKVILR